MINIQSQSTTDATKTSWQICLISTDQIQNLPAQTQEIFKILKFTAKYNNILVLPESQVVYLGLTLEKIKTSDLYYKINYYELGANVYKQIEDYNIDSISLNYHPIFEELSENNFGSFSKSLFDFLLGLSQSSWSFDKYLAKPKSKDISVYFDEKLIHLVTPELTKTLKVLDHSIMLCRNLVESIPEDINPVTLPKIVDSEFANNPRVSIFHYDFDYINSKKMQGISFVGRASRYQPSLVHVIAKPLKETKRKICLVGKGVTYDSGGLDIKTDGHMKTMKMDMAGSATMFGAIRALSELDLEYTEVHWISAFVENMVDGSSYKSDDILTTYSGQTIEIWNTDAEGRLTLADTLAIATLQDPNYIIDAATLTGAAVVAVSEHYTAMMGNDLEMIHDLENTFLVENEKVVHTPLPEALRESVKGKLADLVNTSTVGRQAGHKTAGLFLSHFVDQNNFRNPDLKIESPKAYSWIHLDIAGSAWNKENNDLKTEGATGHAVRSLCSWVMKVDKR